MARCSTCNVPIAEGAELTLSTRSRTSPKLILCPDCAARLDRALALESRGADIPLAVLLGVVAAAAAGAAWFALSILADAHIAVMAVVVGWLVGQAVVLGAGHKRGGALPWISVALTACALCVAQVLILRRPLPQPLAEESATQLPLLLPLDLTLQLLWKVIKASPLTPLFWGIAIWEAYAIPRSRRLRRTQPSHQETSR